MAEAYIKNTIRSLRFHAGEMTQQQLADLAGVTRQTIVAIEKEKYSPSLELAFRIAHAFSVPIGEAFTYVPEHDPLQGSQEKSPQKRKTQGEQK